MEVDYFPRRSGKTSRMLAWLAEDASRILIVRNRDVRGQMRTKYPELAERIMWYGEFLHSGDLTKYRGHSVAIDNAEQVLEEMFFPAHIDSISITRI